MLLSVTNNMFLEIAEEVYKEHNKSSPKSPDSESESSHDDQDSPSAGSPAANNMLGLTGKILNLLIVRCVLR